MSANKCRVGGVLGAGCVCANVTVGGMYCMSDGFCEHKIPPTPSEVVDYKEGLRLAKKFIDVHIGDPDMSNEMIDAHSNYLAFLEHYDLEDL